MMSWIRGRPTGSLFVQLLTLTGLTLVLAEVISLLLIFNLPPPNPDFYRLSEIEQAYRAGQMTFGERRPLTLATVDKPPSPVMQGRNTPRARAQFATDIGVAP